MKDSLIPFFEIFLGVGVVFIIFILTRLLLSSDPREVKKQINDNLSQKDRFRKAVDRFLGRE